MEGIHYFNHLTMKTHSVLGKAVYVTSLKQDAFFHSVTLENSFYSDRGVYLFVCFSQALELRS